MVDVGAAVLAELDLELHLPGGPQAPDVLAHQVLGGGKRPAAAVHGDAFLEVEVDRVIPAAAAIDVGPVLDFAGGGDDIGDAVGVHGVGFPTVHSDGPGEVEHHLRAIGRALTRDRVARVASAAAPELDHAR